MEKYLSEKYDYFNIELPKTEKILDWREHTVMYWIRLTEEYYNKVKLDETKTLLLEELKMEENPEYLEDIIEGLEKENLITINGNLINIVEGV
ncbi:MAG: hypothetical protein CMP21_04200 [Rickettsiales bacterium]|nr:hypothetical protein [Rickettsiales bacterium]|tara:strand:+ start:260 stop:538 length:279 start_codon:yes stop_codon:yes gene_type:complete